MFIVSEDGRSFLRSDKVGYIGHFLSAGRRIVCVGESREAACGMTNDLSEPDAIEMCYMLARAIQDPLCLGKFQVLRLGNTAHMEFLRRQYGVNAKQLKREAA